MKKRTLSFVLALVLVCSMVLPVCAAERAGNGYHWRDIYYNNKKYTATLAAVYDQKSREAYTIISCQAHVRFTLKSVSAVFDTKNHGYITATSTPKSGEFSKKATSVESFHAVCNKGASQVITCLTVAGSAVIYGDGIYQLSARMNNR